MTDAMRDAIHGMAEAFGAASAVRSPAKPTTPEPTSPAPTMDEVIAWESEGYSEATDGCHIEPDGICEHGHPSWMLHFGLI